MISISNNATKDPLAVNFAHLSKNDIEFLLSTSDPLWRTRLMDAAYACKLQEVGRSVHLRGIIEFSNICKKNCLYCGIRKDNHAVQRYAMSKKEILHAAQWIYHARIGSIVLQSGERDDPAFIDFVEEILHEIKALSHGTLGITLSVGEQDYHTYERWFAAGAHRYLLRIESSNPALYKKLHPDNHLYERRLECLHYLRDIGYQVGTGVMIGLPFQTVHDLANDILFFKEQDIDMIGMGPYIVHNQTPLAQHVDHFDRATQLELGLRMVALTRLVLRDVNIASTTALQTLHKDGREMGLKAGANVIMPIVTDTQYKKNYFLYQNKPGADETADELQKTLEQHIHALGETILYDEWGDAPHYFKRQSRTRK